METMSIFIYQTPGKKVLEVTTPHPTPITAPRIKTTSKVSAYEATSNMGLMMLPILCYYW